METIPRIQVFMQCDVLPCRSPIKLRNEKRQSMGAGDRKPNWASLFRCVFHLVGHVHTKASEDNQVKLQHETADSACPIPLLCFNPEFSGPTTLAAASGDTTEESAKTAAADSKNENGQEEEKGAEASEKKGTEAPDAATTTTKPLSVEELFSFVKTASVDEEGPLHRVTRGARMCLSSGKFIEDAMSSDIDMVGRRVHFPQCFRASHLNWGPC